ncbi:PREDICTED: aryl hydrocarbon receptor-like [Buceros rhinoceros silvestris]|uniref:aryl hydrocarbon receptor-like n=1 Tax=Buceros rhinoceros silvestris TaxID=175836 RepID=UPI0005290984|nr:PREDICTED: aryl hydrocarbon receptor-like [Buceros rhinoceros silvestris]
MYAGRKRKKPVPKSPKPPPPEGVKSNPSKRHRDRLNQELNKLTGLLPFPEDVRIRLDKLSVLRLAVGYLKVKSYLMAAATDVGDCMLDQPRAPGGDRRTELQVDRELFPEGELLLQALNGFVIAVTGDGYIFYISPTVQDYLGFHQSDLIYQSVYELIHADDRAAFRRQLHRAPPASSTQHAADAFPTNQPLLAQCSAASCPQHLHPEKTSFVERSFTCRFRCLLDNSSGFLALNFRGRLKFLFGHQKATSGKSLLALFAIATVLQPLSILELQTKTLIFQTKHKLDFTPMACDAWGKVVLGYTEMELCSMGSGYQFVHAADMMHCAESHMKSECRQVGRISSTGWGGLLVWVRLWAPSWLHSSGAARLVYKGGKPDCIISRQRALSNEEGEEHLRKRNPQLPFSFITGEAVLYRNDLPEFLDSFQAKEELQTQANSHLKQRSVDPNSLLGTLMKQDASIYISYADNVPQFSLPDPIAEPKGLSQNEEVGDAKEDSDSLLAVIETLFGKSEVDRYICQTLDVDSAELQQWEEALLSLGAEEKLPAREAGERLDTEGISCVEQMLLREDARKSMDFPRCSASPCSEENNAAAFLQHCWATNSAFQAHQRFTSPQPQAPDAQGQDAVVSLVSVTPEISSAQPEPQVPFNPAGLAQGTVLDVLISSSKSSAALQLANPGQVLQADVTTSASVGNTIPDDHSQPGCKLVGSSCPPPLHSNTLVTQWHDVPVQANPASCPSEAWMATAPKQLEVAETRLKSQTLLGGSSESSSRAGLWVLPSQPAPCPPQGLCESLFSGAGDLHEEEAALPARVSAPLEVSQLPGVGGFPKQPLIPNLEPSFSWERDQALLQEDKRFMQHQPWLLQAGAAPRRCSGGGLAPHSGLLLGSSMSPSTHQMHHVVLPECWYGNSLFRHDSSFLRDSSKISLPQQMGASPCPSESHPGASHSLPGSVLRCSAALTAKVGVGALPSSEQGSGFPSVSFAGGQPLCTCRVQLKVRCEGCRT